MALLSEDDRVEVVGIAANGAEAVELAMELEPDVILMDLKMPMMDGLEATRRLRKHGHQSQILILTGTDEPMSSEKAAKAGASGYLRKEQGIGTCDRIPRGGLARCCPRRARLSVTPALR